MSWLQDQFKDLSIQGQAKNPLQLLVNPMAVGTVGLATLKDQDNKTGWFSNLFKGGSGSGQGSALGLPGAPQENNNKTLYIVIGVVIIILVIVVMSNKRTAP